MNSAEQPNICGLAAPTSGFVEARSDQTVNCPRRTRIKRMQAHSATQKSCSFKKVTMKRILVFALLGPPLGFVTGLSGSSFQILNWALGDPSTFDLHQVVLLPLAYVIGLLPALGVGFFDALLARRGFRWRPLWCGLCGFAMSFLPLVPAFALGFLHGPYVLLFGLIGVPPGAICSWLAGRNADRPTPAGSDGPHVERNAWSRMSGGWDPAASATTRPAVETTESPVARLSSAAPAPRGPSAPHIRYSRRHIDGRRRASVPARDWRARRGNGDHARRTAWCPRTATAP